MTLAASHVSGRSMHSLVHSMSTVPANIFSLNARRTLRPTPSSLRYSVPMPITIFAVDMRFSLSFPLDVQLQEMSGAGDAWIIVTNCLLTLPCQYIFRQVNGLFHV